MYTFEDYEKQPASMLTTVWADPTGEHVGIWDVSVNGMWLGRSGWQRENGYTIHRGPCVWHDALTNETINDPRTIGWVFIGMY